ncbi:hypothetical protein SDC9_134498 [bioreactor metagenome]|uniref:Uncharacterized protein n=1 Tax=bioreactor metagenome TaxID=1076179 RepID=A0A645DFP5_9ZZZZ
MIGAVPLTAVSARDRPIGQFYGVMGFSGQGGYDNGHGSGAAAALSDGAGSAVHLVRPVLIKLVIINHLHAAVREYDSFITLSAALNIILLINTDVLVIAVIDLQVLDGGQLITHCPFCKNG